MTNYKLSGGVGRGINELLRQHQAEGLQTPFTGAAVEAVPHAPPQTSSPETEMIAEAPAQAFWSSMARSPWTAPANLSAATAATNSLRAVFRGLFPTKNLR